jgi:preprotein translocase subunit SecB
MFHRINESVELGMHPASSCLRRIQVFVVELSYGGIASSNVTDEKMLHPLIAIEGPRLLFPFARAIISDATRDGGFMPLNIQPVDFVAVYQHNLAQQAATKTSN